MCDNDFGTIMGCSEHDRRDLVLSTVSFNTVKCPIYPKPPRRPLSITRYPPTEQSGNGDSGTSRGDMHRYHSTITVPLLSVYERRRKDSLTTSLPHG